MMLAVHSMVARAFTTESDQSATTALGIVFRLETMALFVGLGWGSAAQTFVGQNLGAGAPARAKASGAYAALYNGAMMIVVAALYRAEGTPLVAFFDDTPAVLEVATRYINWVGPSYVGLGIGIVLGSAMQGAGATRATLLYDSLVVALFQLPLSVLVVFGLDLGELGLWRVVAATYFAYAVVYLWTYRSGRFLRAS